MKKVRLSSASERVSAAAIFAVILALTVALACVTASDLPALALVLVCGVIAVLLVLFYLITVFRAACQVSPGETTVLVKGFLSYRMDVSGAASVQTGAVSGGPVSSRSILFLGSDGETLQTLPTSFTARGGVMAEPAAMELAQALGLAFTPTLPRWEYDKAARKEREAELARRRKEERAARPSWKARLKQRFPGGRPAEKAAPPQRGPRPEREEVPAPPEVDYDALDDER